jgi:N-acetyl-anhydromuramyl-L-alanine amidase AmpD
MKILSCVLKKFKKTKQNVTLINQHQTMPATDYKSEVLSRVEFVPLPETSYVKEEVPKRTIFLHHTAGNGNPYQVVEWWRKQANQVATAYIIGGFGQYDGKLIQTFDDKYWAWHLGLKQANLPRGSNNKVLNAQAIAIEMCSWGPLVKKGDKFYSYAGTVVPYEQVATLAIPFRGYIYYQAYSQKQLETLKLLLLYLIDKYQISKENNHLTEMFQVTRDALLGKDGIWGHCSVRLDKWDVFPDPHLIQVLENVLQESPTISV